MKIKIVFVLIMIVISGCYRPHWYRENTTYAQLKADSEWCKTQTKIGASRSEMIEQYEVCMEGKGYELKDKSDPSGGGESIIEERKEDPPIVIDKRTKVYIGLFASDGVKTTMTPAYRYFHKKDCKHLWSVSVKEMTAGEAIAEGLIPCPDCYR